MASSTRTTRMDYTLRSRSYGSIEKQYMTSVPASGITVDHENSLHVSVPRLKTWSELRKSPEVIGRGIYIADQPCLQRLGSSRSNQARKERQLILVSASGRVITSSRLAIVRLVHRSGTATRAGLTCITSLSTFGRTSLVQHFSLCSHYGSSQPKCHLDMLSRPSPTCSCAFCISWA